eukprot:6197508-Pleurochrysis_carterae.AAC.6
MLGNEDSVRKASEPGARLRRRGTARMGPWRRGDGGLARSRRDAIACFLFRAIASREGSGERVPPPATSAR